MKQPIIYVLAAGIAFVCLAGGAKYVSQAANNTDTIVHKIGCRLFELNTISIEADSSIDLNQVHIVINGHPVFEEGEQVNRVGQEYGHRVFEIYHKEVLIAEVGHFRRNNWYTNQYVFDLSQSGESISVEHQIDGPGAHEDEFRKQYVYDDQHHLVRIDYLNRKGDIYHSESFAGA